MSVRFILGRAGSGKTYYCLSEMARLLQEQQAGPVLFLLPEQATFIHERMLACDFTPHGYSGGEVVSFNRLVWQAARRAGQEAKPALSEAGRAVLMGRLLSERQGRLKLFGAAPLGHGLAAQLASLAEELLVYDIQAQSLAELAQARLAARPLDPLAAKLHDLALLYGDYALALAAYDNTAEGLAFLAQEIEEHGFLAQATVFVDGASTFTPREQAVLAALMRRAARLEIALALDPQDLERPLTEQDIFYPSWQSYGRLSEAARRAGVRVEPPLCLDGAKGRFAHNPELALLERHCYPWVGGPAWPEQPRSLRLTLAASPREELQAAGREIQRLVREEGLRYRQISVITRDLAPYEQLLPEVFGGLDIPYFADSKKTLLYHPLVELARAALEVWANEAAYRHIFRYFKTGLTPLSLAEVDELENYCLAHGLRQWQWREDKEWRYWRGAPEQAAECLAALNELRQRGTQALSRFLAAAPPATGPVEAQALIQALLGLLTELKVEQTLSAWQEQALAEGQADQAELHRQALSRLSDFLAETQALLPGSNLNAQQLLSLIDAGCTSLTLSMIPPGLDQVLVASLERSRNPELGAAIVLGLNADQLPRKSQPTPLLADQERQELAQAGLELAPATLARQTAEHYLAYVALTRSGQRLLLSYAQSSNDGKPLLPSPLLKRLRRLFPALTAGHYGEPQQPEELTGGAETLWQLSRRLMAARAGAELPGWWRDVYNWYADKESHSAAFAQLKRGIFFAPHQGRLGEPARQRLYGQVIRSSVSRLEKFNACPFAYFAAYGLKLRPRQVYEITPLERGDIFHRALSELSQILSAGQAWQELDEPQAAALVAEVLASLLPQYLSGILSSTARYRYQAARLQDTLTATLLLIAEQLRRGQFKPVAWELPFGNRAGDALPPLTLTLADGRRLELNGQIDRVDVARAGGQAYVRVIDYKTGKLKLSLADILSGLRLQLAVYLQVALANPRYFQVPELQAAGLYYMMVKDELVSSPMPPAGEESAPAGLKMSGLTIKDELAVRLSDREINGHSQLIPVALSAKGFYNNSPGLALEELEQLRLSLEQVLRDSAAKMAGGLTAVAPRQGAGFDACAYCDYRELCGFDGEWARQGGVKHAL